MSSDQVVSGAQTMSEVIASSLAGAQFSMVLFGIFAALALLLASIGIYGVVSYLAGQRTHEIGVRMAMGARRRDVLRLVLGQGLKMAFLGVAVGIAAALALTRLMANYSSESGATDPITFAGVGIISDLRCIGCMFSCLPEERRESIRWWRLGTSEPKKQSSNGLKLPD